MSAGVPEKEPQGVDITIGASWANNEKFITVIINAVINNFFFIM